MIITNNFIRVIIILTNNFIRIIIILTNNFIYVIIKSAAINSCNVLLGGGGVDIFFISMIELNCSVLNHSYAVIQRCR